MPGFGRGYGRGRRRGSGRGGGRGRFGPGPARIPFPDEEHEGPVELTIEELEALKLCDLEGLTQEEAASKLGIARRTIWSDLNNARRKVAHAIVNGLPIRIIGGSLVLE